MLYTWTVGVDPFKLTQKKTYQPWLPFLKTKLSQGVIIFQSLLPPATCSNSSAFNVSGVVEWLWPMIYGGPVKVNVFGTSPTILIIMVPLSCETGAKKWTLMLLGCVCVCFDHEVIKGRWLVVSSVCSFAVKKRAASPSSGLPITRYPLQTRESTKDEINVPIALGAFRDKKRESFCRRKSSSVSTFHFFPPVSPTRCRDPCTFSQNLKKNCISVRSYLDYLMLFALHGAFE